MRWKRFDPTLSWLSNKLANNRCLKDFVVARNSCSAAIAKGGYLLRAPKGMNSGFVRRLQTLT